MQSSSKLFLTYNFDSVFLIKFFHLSLRPFKKALTLNSSNQFNIQFSGLSIGVHQFSFEINNQFFAELEGALIEKGNVLANVELDRRETMLVLKLSFEGFVDVTCDRCTTQAPFPVEGNAKMIIKLSDSEESPDNEDDIISIDRNEYAFDMSQHLYDYIALSLPLRTVPCEIDGDNSICDQIVIEKLEGLKVNELPENEENIDPRWEKLRQLGGINPN